MYHIFQILGAILTGAALGTILGPRVPVRFIGGIIAVALGLITIFTGQWLTLAVGAAVLFVAQILRGDNASSKA